MVMSSLMPPPYPAAPGIHARQDPGMDDAECCEVVITGDDADRLLALTRTLVEEPLAGGGRVGRVGKVGPGCALVLPEGGGGARRPGGGGRVTHPPLAGPGGRRADPR